MLKYLSTAVVFAEVPDEISLALQITNCPHRCPGCHSPELTQDIGEELSDAALRRLLDKYRRKGVTCICLMGGDSDHGDVARLADTVRKAGMKACFYSGDDEIDESLIKHLDYYKVGSWKEESGPLNKETTNQRMYRCPEMEDITSKFWKR